MQSISSILKAVQHPTRRKILRTLCDSPEKVSYTYLLGFVDNSTGKINYHLRVLSDLITKTEGGYMINKQGKEVVSWLESLEGNSSDGEMERPHILLSPFHPAESLLKKYLLVVDSSALFLIGTFGSTALRLIRAFPFGGMVMSILTGIAILAWLVVRATVVRYYKTIEYTISDTEVRVTKGVITHTEKIVPFRTITNVEIHVGPLDRLFGIGTVVIHTAGSTVGPEEKLDGLVEPHEVKNTILEYIRLLNPPKFMSNGEEQEKERIQKLYEVEKELHELNNDLLQS